MPNPMPNMIDNPFSMHNRPMPNQNLDRNVNPNPFAGGLPSMDIDAMMKDIDQKLKELDEEEKRQKEKLKEQSKLLTEEPVKVETKQEQTTLFENKPKEEVKELNNEVEKQSEKPKINIDVDSVIVNENVITDDEFFDDFFGEDE